MRRQDQKKGLMFLTTVNTRTDEFTTKKNSIELIDIKNN